MSKVRFHKGLKANLPSTGLAVGHYYQCTDTGELYLATSSTDLVLVSNGETGIRYTPQSLTDAQKEQARRNIGAEGEANILEAVKVNGAALAISDKAVNLETATDADIDALFY